MIVRIILAQREGKSGQTRDRINLGVPISSRDVLITALPS